MISGNVMYFGPVSVISITIERRTPTTRFQRVHIGCVQSSKFLSTVLEKYQHLYNILWSKRLLNRFHHFISTFINSFIAKTFLTSPICIFSIISDVCLSFFLTIHFCPRVICTKLNEANFFQTGAIATTIFHTIYSLLLHLVFYSNRINIFTYNWQSANPTNLLENL